MKTPFACKSCSHVTFKDSASLQRHVSNLHTRAFVCVFGFAGCPSTFASKNEWKRHNASQHLNLNYWRCELENCGKAHAQASPKGSSSSGSGAAGLRGSEFNRKDLYTQHLRRMHAPFAVKRMNKKNAEWDERVKQLQVSAVRQRRSPPLLLGCPVKGCDTRFEGLSAWDDRMEHVGKHLEKTASGGSAGGQHAKLVVEHERDELLVAWALRERIVERRPGGEYRLCGGWKENGGGEDVDAEGEDE